MREMLREFVQFSDGLVLCGVAESAEQASRELESARPTIVLVDLSLPDRSGFDFLAEIRDRWKIPCMALSGHSERVYVDRAFAAGAGGYMVKGSLAELPAAIRTVLGGVPFLSESLRVRLDYDMDSFGT